MSEVKFYRCRHCGNLVAVVEDAGPVPVCCGEPMELLVAGSVDAAAEKHVAAFHVPAGAPVTVYEYCNLHGLWKAEA